MLFNFDEAFDLESLAKALLTRIGFSRKLTIRKSNTIKKATPPVLLPSLLKSYF